MLYFVSILIAIILGFLETSFLPHFPIFGTVPFLMLAYITALSLKNKGYFQLFIAFAAGLFYDYISSGFSYTFLLVFILTVLSVKLFLYRETSYDVMPMFLSVLAVSSIAVYALQAGVLFTTNYIGWQKFLLTAVVGVLLTLIFGYLLFRLLSGYFDWLEKESEEKFRG